MKLKKITIIQIIACIIGLSLLLYPSLSNYWNSKHATSAINNYVDTLNEKTNTELESMLEDAKTYNEDLLKRDNQYTLNKELTKRYNSLLNINKDGIMGYIEIEKIGVELPLYHGISEDVLQKSIGHLEWTSLPIGGESTHAVVSGHRGLPNMKLFTDLDKLSIGDTFTVTVLNKTITYEIDQIKTVNPDETSDLVIEEGSDYMTLVTCTPYGINTHRLLVRGHRTNNIVSSKRIVSEAVKIDKIIIASFLALPVLFILLLIVILKKPNTIKKRIIGELYEKNNL